MEDITRRSRFLSLVLRHRPEELGITLEAGGWVKVNVLLEALKEAGRGMSRAQLERLVAENGKRRFAFSPCGSKIRASQGHSVPVDLGLEAAEPPERLYHGTVQNRLRDISEQGLLKGRRHAVHLSTDVETAIAVGSRRGCPVILPIRAGEMHRAGHLFQVSENGVWLTDHVDAKFIDWAAIIRR